MPAVAPAARVQREGATIESPSARTSRPGRSGRPNSALAGPQPAVRSHGSRRSHCVPTRRAADLTPGGATAATPCQPRRRRRPRGGATRRPCGCRVGLRLAGPPATDDRPIERGVEEAPADERVFARIGAIRPTISTCPAWTRPPERQHRPSSLQAAQSAYRTNIARSLLHCE